MRYNRPNGIQNKTWHRALYQNTAPIQQLYLNVERPLVRVQYSPVGTEVEAVGEGPDPPVCRLRLLQPRPDTPHGHSGVTLKVATNRGRATTDSPGS